jgi:predicted transcriptional regulator
MLERIRIDRTKRASELVALALSGARQAEIADQLEISRQAVSKQLKSAGLEEERLGRRAAVELLNSLG